MWCEIVSQRHQGVDNITCRNSKHIMLGFPLIIHRKLLEWNLEVSAVKTAAGYFKSEAELDKGIGPLFPPLEKANLNRQRIFPPLLQIDWTSENITIAATAIRPPWHAEYVAATCYSVLYCWDKGILDDFIYLFIFWKHNGHGSEEIKTITWEQATSPFDNLGIITAKRHKHTDMV